MSTSSATKEKIVYSPDNFIVGSLCRWLLVSMVMFYLGFVILFNHPNSPASEFFPVKFRRMAQPIIQSNSITNDSPTNLSHLVFCLLGSETALHYRQHYIHSWWRPNATRGYLYLDAAPTGDLLPWSAASPPYRVSDDISKLLEETEALVPFAVRMVHGIMEVFREEHGDFRWLVVGDDDSIFFVDNIVDVVAKSDHTKYYYLGGQSEFILSNHWFSFKQGFGGAGYILSYPLAKALANGMESCLRRNAQLRTADLIAMVCIADIGVDLSPQGGLHQIDLHGHISGLLSSHPQAPLMSLHHFDEVEPIFPSMNSFESAFHLMKAASLDQSRLLQQTICHQRSQTNWSFSIAWGYSVHIYEKIMSRSWLRDPIETFASWMTNPDPPRYMFNTRETSSDPCEAPHIFYFQSINKHSDDEILTLYSRASPRGLPPCSSNANGSADDISTIEVFSPATKRIENGRCECCDVVEVVDMKIARVKLRQCMMDELIA